MGKRKKRSRLRGRKTCGYGSKKKHRGSGSRGGKGMAGTGKRAGHLRTFILKYMPDYFGKHGFYRKKAEMKTININEIEEKLPYFLNENIAKKTAQGIALNLSEYKILGKGKARNKFFIEAREASESARKKIGEAGGEIKITERQEEEKKPVEKPEEKKVLEEKKPEEAKEILKKRRKNKKVKRRKDNRVDN